MRSDIARNSISVEGDLVDDVTAGRHNEAIPSPPCLRSLCLYWRRVLEPMLAMQRSGLCSHRRQRGRRRHQSLRCRPFTADVERLGRSGGVTSIVLDLQIALRATSESPLERWSSISGRWDGP